MRDRLFEHQRAALGEKLDDLRIRFEHLDARPLRHLVSEFAAAVHGRVDVESVAFAGVEVIDTVTG